VVVKTGFGAILRKRYAYPMPEMRAWEIDTLAKLERAEFDDPRDRRRFFTAGDNQIAGVGDYRQALLLNPRLSQAWVDLADCDERTGKFNEAEAALEQAFTTHTYSPLIRWQAATFSSAGEICPKCTNASR
jgi:tetratricopeptide (TPR) repeat protein